MESRIEKKKRRFQIEKLEERIAPAHVDLPASVAMEVDLSRAPEKNPHFSGVLRPLPIKQGFN